MSTTSTTPAASSHPSSSANYTLLISGDQLQALQASDAPLMIFDCSFDLSDPEWGYQQYLASHIPGAHYAHLDQHLSVHFASEVCSSGGRHPLPIRENFADWLSSLGLTPDMQAVVYDRNHSMVAGRLWWMLKWLGHDAAAVLDGGFQKWHASQGLLSKGLEPSSPASPYPIGLPRVTLVDADDVARCINHPSAGIVDARAPARFKGETEPLDPKAGHIPSALNRPFMSNFDDATGCFKPAAQLRREFEALLAGKDPARTIHHCGSGVSAVPNIVAMAHAGFGMTALYAGSWSDWCSDPSRPVAKG